ncbi:dolichyl-diphosphooligosaccharide--protein glycosyltransferase subunit 1-like isoform X1 [Photinus pyralis]|uniref:Dolichyl-diphosphooligosaccharide--protein glycosyltransferase subunit 1 n=1 Tax=Photinus pyralis TaxID=7054 RepID=A0A1Y1K1E3_PHOPY|nr:dolichyl-diphosphooligosaccharide--protein glycosyltransferase subunit 1-like isoform X1 [Photinus pyralis]XP_031351702.1 dolichyl-diphosphooligosaccharide--protein glycosyltransferase subunit 1-like isoform X1 [Photinus pyralis]
MKCVILVTLAIFATNCEIINKSVIRNVRFFGGLHVKEEIRIIMLNNGTQSVDHFRYWLDPNVVNFIVKFSGENGTLTHETTTEAPDEFRVNLQSNFKPGHVLKVVVNLISFGQVVPVQNTLMGPHQSVVYRGNVGFYSGYKTSIATSSFTLKPEGMKALQISPSPLYQLEGSVEYITKNISPLSLTRLTVAYQDNTPLITILSLKRLITVSHFGKIFVSDQVSVKNEGRFNSSFPYMNVNNFDWWWYTHLPATADDVGYFDELGNSSKSTLLHYKNYKTLKFQPRYPLLNGWKTSYVIRYSVPSVHYLWNHVDEFSLKMRAVDHIFDDVLIKDAIVKVLLPEGATIINVTLPGLFTKFDVGQSTFGRPQIIFGAKSVFESFEDFHIQYFLPKYYLLKTPLLIVLSLECLFVIFITAYWV